MAAFEDRSSPDLEQFKGGKWADWLAANQSSQTKPQTAPEHSSKRDVEVARLRRPDATLFGYRPATDKFYLVVCAFCGHLMKPQSINIHYERKHKSKRVTRLPSSSGTRVADQRRKHSTTNKSNHRMLSPSRLSRHPIVHEKGPSNSGRRASVTEHSVDNSKSQPKPEKIFPAAENERHGYDGNSSKNHKCERSAANVPNSASPRGSTVSSHLSGSEKRVQRTGSTIHPKENSEFRALKSGFLSSSDSSPKHQNHRHDKANKSKGKSRELDSAFAANCKKRESVDSGVSRKKSRKNHDSYHHHYHESGPKASITDRDLTSPDYSKLISAKPQAEKFRTSANDDKLDHPHKRSRPVSGSLELSALPQRHKACALDGSVENEASPAPKVSESAPNSAAPAKARKKEKMLPLKARKYDPNRHCGVFVNEESAHCRRSLTCKVHSLSTKRAVPGRRKKFDELVQEHGREKLRQKEKNTASDSLMLPLAGQSVKSPVPSPASFATSLQATTPLSSPACSTMMSPSMPQTPMSPAAPKVKPSISLFPRVFAAWHVDCWDSDEITEDALAKSQYSCYCTQRYPQPIAVFNFQARRSGSCQTSHNRKLERQLEAFSSNIVKFGSKQVQKARKPFSFSPISAATYHPSRSQLPHTATGLKSQRTAAQKVLKRCSQKHSGAASNDLRAASTQNTFSPSHTTTTTFHIIQPKPIRTNRKSVNCKLSSLALPNGQVRRSLTEAASSTSVLTVNDIAVETLSSPQTSIRGSPGQVSSDSTRVTLYQIQENAEKKNHVLARQEGKTAKLECLKMQSQLAKSVPSERIDGKSLMAQLPNGIHRQTAQSVTLSGNIGALTVPECTLSGNQLLKPPRSNSFVMSNAEAQPGRILAKTKRLPLGQSTGPANSGVLEGILLQNDNFLMNSPRAVGHTTNLQNHQCAVQGPNYPATITLKSVPSQGDTGNTAATGDLFELVCGRADSTRSLTATREKYDTQLTNLNEIDFGSGLWSIQQTDDA